MSTEPEILPTFTPSTIEPVQTRRFPAVAQLIVLIVCLGALFIGFLIPGWRTPASVTPVVETAPASSSTASLPIISSITPPPLSARAVYVYDVATGRALYEKNADEVLPLASITKLMTTLVAYNIMAPDTPVTVPQSATVIQSPSGLRPGEVITHEALNTFAMMASSNDAAESLAAAAGALIDEDAPRQTFIEAMNVTAEELGLPTLRFYNATGLDESPTTAGAYGSARDVTFLLEHIVKTAPALLPATTDPYERIYNSTGAFHEAENTNPAINQIPQLLGSKTGYTDLAGGNLTIVYDAGFNRPIIITVLGSGFDERFTDVLRLVSSVNEAFATAGSTTVTE